MTSTQSQLIIREATSDDVPVLMQLMQQLGDETPPEPEAAQALFATVTQNPQHVVYVAVQAERIVGMYCLILVQHLGHGGTRSAIVEDVAVNGDFQGQGIGQAMMRHAAERARAAGCYKILLSSSVKREAAHRFYEKLGFQRYGYSFALDLQEAADE